MPPGIGIVHQVNLEYLARGVMEKDGVWYPDTLVGTDSHTTMINGLGIVGWGVGGIEAEAGMLGQPVYFLTPDVVGVHLTGALKEGVTATDLVLTITEMLRKAKVVGKFVEYFGDGAASLSLADRATIANMAPEYGATMGFFPIDEESCSYLLLTGRTEEQVDDDPQLLQGAGTVRHSAQGTDRVLEGARARSGDGEAERRRTEAAAGPHRADEAEAHSFINELQKAPPAGYGKPASEIERKTRDDRRGDPAGRRRRRHAGRGTDTESVREKEHERAD